MDLHRHRNAALHPVARYGEAIGVVALALAIGEAVTGRSC